MKIDLVDLLITIIERKRKVYRYMLVFLIIGLILLVITPKEYTSSAIILPQIASEKGLSKKYSNIAALVGINLGQAEGNKIVPTLYPVIVEGAPFQKALVQSKINIEKLENSITLIDYLQNYKNNGPLGFIKEYTIGLPGKIIGFFKSDDRSSVYKPLDNTLFRYSEEEITSINYLKDHLFISFDEDNGFINITAVMDEPVLAAQLVRNAQNLLQVFIINYNIKKSKDELMFIEERLEVAKKEYGDKRAILGDFRDRNKNRILSTARSKEEQLKAEYELAYNMYSELSGQKESAKLQVERDTPIFTELKPAFVASEPSSPIKFKYILGSLIIGMLFGIIAIVQKLILPIILAPLKKNEV